VIRYSYFELATPDMCSWLSVFIFLTHHVFLINLSMELEKQNYSIIIFRLLYEDTELEPPFPQKFDTNLDSSYVEN
jgi:hypothetical protein